MANEADPSIHLPEALQERLNAAGVTDQASLEAALHTDPELKRDFVAFLAQHQTAVVQVMMQQWLSQFAAVPDQPALEQFWQQVPLEMEDDFMAIVEQAIIEVQQSGEEHAVQVAEGLRARLEKLERLRKEQTAISEQVTQWAASLETTPDEAIALVWSDIPRDLEDGVLELAEQRAASLQQDGHAETAARLYARVVALRQAQTIRDDPANQPPLVRALLAFLEAENDDVARQVYIEQQELLQSHEARQLLATMVVQVSPNLQAGFQARNELLHRLCGYVEQKR